MASKSRLYIPAFGGLYESLSPYAELLLRAGLGAILVCRSFSAGTAAPELSERRHCSTSSAIRRRWR